MAPFTIKGPIQFIKNLIRKIKFSPPRNNEPNFTLGFSLSKMKGELINDNDILKSISYLVNDDIPSPLRCQSDHILSTLGQLSNELLPIGHMLLTWFSIYLQDEKKLLKKNGHMY